MGKDCLDFAGFLPFTVQRITGFIGYLFHLSTLPIQDSSINMGFVGCTQVKKIF
jgi:hypothetical protein